MQDRHGEEYAPSNDTSQQPQMNVSYITFH